MKDDLSEPIPPIVRRRNALFQNWLAGGFRWRPFRLRFPLVRRLSGREKVSADYRDRISVATWVFAFGLGSSLLFELPTVVFSFSALGSPISVPLTGTILATIFLAIVAAAGAESVITVHPAFVGTYGRLRSSTWVFWALPMAITFISVVLLPLAPSPLIQVIALIVSSVLLALSLYGLYTTVERGGPGFRSSRLLVDALAYGCALLLFLFVYQMRTRSLLSGTLVAFTAMLLAVEILRTVTDGPGIALTYGGIVGLILGQVTWALNYWRLPGLTGGLLLLLAFYLLVGIAQQGLQGRLNRRVLLEFGVFALVALILIALVGPGFQV